jgi:peroxiredoxin
LADFQQHKSEFDAREVRIVAVSADPESAAAATVDSLGLELPVGYGLDVDAAALTIGCYTGSHEGCTHVQPAGFVLRSDGIIALAVYSSGKVGRLTATDALAALPRPPDQPSTETPFRP